MYRALIFAAAITAGHMTVQLSLKDPPPVPEKAHAHYYLYIEGFSGRMEVPVWIMSRYALRNGDHITVVMARVIAHDMGFGYEPRLRIFLRDLDQQENPNE